MSETKCLCFGRLPLNGGFKIVACIDLILAVVIACVPHMISEHRIKLFFELNLIKYSLVAAFVSSGVSGFIAAFTQNTIVLKISEIISMIKTFVCELWCFSWFCIAGIIFMMDLMKWKAQDSVTILFLVIFGAVLALEMYFAFAVRKKFFAQFNEKENKFNQEEEVDSNA